MHSKPQQVTEHHQTQSEPNLHWVTGVIAIATPVLLLGVLFSIGWDYSSGLGLFFVWIALFTTNVVFPALMLVLTTLFISTQPNREQFATLRLTNMSSEDISNTFAN